MVFYHSCENTVLTIRRAHCGSTLSKGLAVQTFALQISAFCGCGGTGRRARFRFLCPSGVQVRFLSSALCSTPTKWVCCQATICVANCLDLPIAGVLEQWDSHCFYFSENSEKSGIFHFSILFSILLSRTYVLFQQNSLSNRSNFVGCSGHLQP